MIIALYVMAAWSALGALMVVGGIGKPRKPTTPGTAAFIVAVNAGWAFVLILAARRLS